MAQITAADVKSLRDKTGLPMMECKKALTAAGGDEAKAIEELRKSGAKTAAKQAGRSTTSGRIAVYTDASVGSIVELRCETAPVANHEEFIALAADLRLACQGAGKIGLPEVNLGVLPGTGGTQRLVRLVGKPCALELMATGETFDFERAHEIGLIEKLIDAEGFFDTVLEYARGFVPPAKASRAVGLIKRAVQSGAEMGLSEGLALERELQQRLFQGDDAAEGLAAYAEKRKPRFTGK